MEEESGFESPEVAPPDKGAQFWHRIGVASSRLILFSVAVVLFRLVQISVEGGKSDPSLLTRCLGMAALTSFVIGTLLADLWVLRSLVMGATQSGSLDRRMNPIFSLLLTCRLGSEVTQGIEKDILSAKALGALFATVLSFFLVVLLWTLK